MDNDVHCAEERPLENQANDALDEINEAITQLTSLLTMIVGDDGFDAFEILSRTPKMGYIWTCSRLAHATGDAFERFLKIQDELRCAPAEKDHG